MFNLIKNEWIKLISRPSTWIVLALLLLCSLALPLFPLMGDFLDDSFAYQASDEEIYENERQWAVSDTGMSEVDRTVLLAVIDFCSENGVPSDYYYGIDWQGEAIHDAFYTYYQTLLYNEDTLSADQKAALQEGMDVATAAVLQHDWRSYYEFKAKEAREGAMDAAEGDALAYAYTYFLERDVEPLDDEYRKQLMNIYQAYRSSYQDILVKKESGESYDRKEFDRVSTPFLTAEYCLKNEISSYIWKDPERGVENIEGNFFYGMQMETAAISFLAVFLIVIAGGIIAREFSQGTIKFLLINPRGRGKILFSKYLLMILMALIIPVIFFVLSLLICILVYGTGQLGTPYLSVSDGVLTVNSAFFYIARLYATEILEAVIYATMAFMISALLRSSSLAIGLSIAVFFGGGTITSVLSVFNLDFGRYLIFANADLSVFLQNSYSLFPNHTLPFALGVIAVHMVIFLLTAYDAFKKRDV